MGRERKGIFKREEMTPCCFQCTYTTLSFVKHAVIIDTVYKD
jgi:hypothetical protein